MPEVVSDTTPLIALSKISKLDLLEVLYGEINIPAGVFEEYEEGKNKDFYKEILKLDWIKIREIKNKKELENYPELDRGEKEAIALAEEIKGDLLIIDEVRGRKIAKSKGLKITGTVGVLLKAKKKRSIHEVLPFVYELRDKGTWIGDDLIEFIKETEEES
jgi:predicted nucleic acid-binding protein